MYYTKAMEKATAHLMEQNGAEDQAGQHDGLILKIHVDTSEIDAAIKKLKELRGLYYSVQALNKKWGTR